MAELPADVTVKAEEAPPAAPAGYDGPGPLNEPPETVAQAAPPPPPADEQTPQVAQQTPVEMTPEHDSRPLSPPVSRTIQLESLLRGRRGLHPACPRGT